MRFLTDRKRATGLGSAKSGVHHFWTMKITSVALLILVPLFIFVCAPLLGEPHADVTAAFQRPAVAIIALLTMIVGFKHLNDGMQVMIEDYIHGTKQKIVLILMTCLNYGAMAIGLYAIAKLAL